MQGCRCAGGGRSPPGWRGSHALSKRPGACRGCRRAGVLPRHLRGSRSSSPVDLCKVLQLAGVPAQMRDEQLLLGVGMGLFPGCRTYSPSAASFPTQQTGKGTGFSGSPGCPPARVSKEEWLKVALVQTNPNFSQRRVSRFSPIDFRGKSSLTNLRWLLHPSQHGCRGPTPCWPTTTSSDATHGDESNRCDSARLA